MRDCSNAEMREGLPDLLNDRLSADVRAKVQAHLESCTDCRAELELLTRVRAAIRAPAIDASRIAAAVPPYRRSFWSRVTHAPQLRIAAAIVLVVGSIWAVMREQQTSEVTLINQTPVTQPSMSAAPPATSVATELAVGEPLTDLTEADLNALIEELDELDAVTPTETDVEMPSVRGSE